MRKIVKTAFFFTILTMIISCGEKSPKQTNKNIDSLSNGGAFSKVLEGAVLEVINYVNTVDGPDDKFQRRYIIGLEKDNDNCLITIGMGSYCAEGVQGLYALIGKHLIMMYGDSLVINKMEHRMARLVNFSKLKYFKDSIPGYSNDTSIISDFPEWKFQIITLDSLKRITN